MRIARSALAIALLVALAAGSSAAAATFCVAKPSCAGTSEPDLPTALTDAAAALGRDRIELGAGTIPYAGVATDAAGNQVDIVGAGRHDTTLQATGTVLSMQEPASTFSDARIVASGSPVAVADLAAGTFRRVDVDLTGTDPSAAPVAFALHGGGAVLDDAVVVAGTAGQTSYAVRDDSAAADVAPVVRHLAATAAFGIYLTGDGAMSVESSDLRGRIAGARVAGGTLTIDDTIARAAGGAVGLSSDTGGSGSASLVARQVTVLLSAGATGVQTGPAGSSLSGDGVVVHGAGTAVAAGAGSSVTLDYSAYPFAAATGTFTGGTARHDVDLTTAAPGFVDENAGDARLTASSPLVDAGDPGLTAGPGVDLAGQPRLRDGTGDGAALRDIGAYEYQRVAPTVSATATPASAGTDQEVAFAAVAADADPGEVPTVRWAFDDGSTLAGAAVSHAFATAGTHTATATATDPSGLTATTTLSIQVVGDNVPLPAHGPRIFVRVLRSRLDRRRTFLIGVFCPATERPRCVGSITAMRNGVRVGYTPLRISPGGSQLAKVPVSRTTAAVAHRRKRLPIVASVNATDLLGHATTKTVRVVLRPFR